MKRVGDSKEPNVRQMLNMASNLHEMFSKASMIKAEAWRYSSAGKEIHYKIYIEDQPLMEFKTWKETLNYYRGLIKGGKKAKRGAK